MKCLTSGSLRSDEFLVRWVTLPEIPLTVVFGDEQGLWNYVRSIPEVLCALVGLSYSEWTVTVWEIIDGGVNPVLDRPRASVRCFFHRRKDKSLEDSGTKPSLPIDHKLKRRITFDDE